MRTNYRCIILAFLLIYVDAATKLLEIRLLDPFYRETVAGRLHQFRRIQTNRCTTRVDTEKHLIETLQLKRYPHMTHILLKETPIWGEAGWCYITFKKGVNNGRITQPCKIFHEISKAGSKWSSPKRSKTATFSSRKTK